MSSFELEIKVMLWLIGLNIQFANNRISTFETGERERYCCR